MNTIAQTKLDFYALFCGVFLYSGKNRNGTVKNVPWIQRIGEPATFYEYLSRTYYPGYVNNIFNDTPAQVKTQTSLIEHTTVASLLTQPFGCTLEARENIDISIPYFDCFLFPDGIGIFCFKVEFGGTTEASYERISQVVAGMRNPQSRLTRPEGAQTVVSFIQQQLETSYEIPSHWNRYVPQLKVYCMVNDTQRSEFNTEMDRTLFELAHAMPVGTINRGLSDKPTDVYFDTVMKRSSIFIYNNWKAIGLLDSFTRISCGQSDPFRTWEIDYFHIYIHCLYCKFQLYFFNSQLTDVLHSNKKAKTIRDRFVEFVNDFSLPYISYKFLPNVLYEKITAALEITREQDEMEKKVDRLNEAYQSKRSKQMNVLLLVISLLSLVSVFNDFSQWLVNMGAPVTAIYSPFSVLTYFIAVGATAWLVFRRS